MAYVDGFSTTMVDVVYEWCKGAKFAELMAMGDFFEGSIIRMLHRLEELLRQIMDAAKVTAAPDSACICRSLTHFACRACTCRACRACVRACVRTCVRAALTAPHSAPKPLEGGGERGPRGEVGRRTKAACARRSLCSIALHVIRCR